MMTMLVHAFRKPFFVLFLVFLTLFSGRAYLQPNFPYTHDGENHLARFANYKIAIKEGQFPPRFAPNLLNHYGYPVFNYNYPLANILSSPFSFLKINYEITFKILAISSMLLGFIGIFVWLKKLGYENRSRYIALFTYSLSPYLANLTFFRGNIGELLALNIFPWLLYFSERGIAKYESQKNTWTLNVFILACITWSAFLLSHNITALFGTPLVILYFLVRTHFRRQISNPNWKQKYQFLLSFVFGLSLSVWFWIPAVFEKSLIVLDNSSFFSEFTQHFPTVEELVLSSMRFGFSFVGSVDTLGFSLGFIQIVFLLASSIIFLKNQERKIRLFLIFCWALIFFQLAITKIFWQNIPFASYIQFPWRLSLFFAIFILPLAAWSYQHLTTNWKKIILFFLFIQCISYLRMKPVDTFHRTNIDYDAFSQSTSTLNENTAKSFTFSDISNWQPSAQIQSGSAEIITHFWNGSHREYTVVVNENALIIEPTMYFTGWESYFSNPQSADPQQRTRIEYAHEELTGGRIAFWLQPGQYLIETKFTQKTWPRITGNVFSSLTALLLFFLIFKNWKTMKS